MTKTDAYQHLQAKLANDECLVLDGAVATELQALGARDFQLSDADHWGFEALHFAPESVAEVHGNYVAAGCDVITTNTYGILDAPKSVTSATATQHWMELSRRAVRIARDSIDAAGRQESCAVAYSIGGDIGSEDDLTTIRLLLRSLREAPPDLVLLETLTMLKSDYTRQAMDLIQESGLPVWLSFRRCREGVCGIHGQLWGGPEGDYFGRLASEMEQKGAGALLINCLPPHRVSGTLPWLREFTDLPLGVYPNLGRYVDPEWRFDEDVTPEDFADMSLIWRAEGAQILGGCCGARPSHIEALAKAVKDTAPYGPIGETGRMRVYEKPQEPAPAVWTDADERQIFPLPLPEIQCDPGVFVPTQGSYLVWKHLHNTGLGQGKRCLDIGCGAGLLAIQMALNGAEEVLAMDIDEAAVANTLTNAFRNNVSDQVKGKVTDLYTLKPREQYDVIVASLYQMPTDPEGQYSGHRPVDYWGRNLLDHCIGLLPTMLAKDGRAYIMQISLVGQAETERRLTAAGFKSRVIDYSLFQFTPVFLENLEQIERVANESDAFHFKFGDGRVMVMYLLEVQHAAAAD
ncbi:MAG: homocysteine S-methyltransferase family protein [Pseudomonadota bacterium]